MEVTIISRTARAIAVGVGYIAWRHPPDAWRAFILDFLEHYFLI
jgi:hypothetical protein